LNDLNAIPRRIERTGTSSRTCMAWAALGSAGEISKVYRDHRPERGVDPTRLRALLGSLDARGDVGVVLSSCVQLATALPLLAESAPDSPATAATLSGAAITALAATDIGAGSDLTSLCTRVEKLSNGIMVTGEKRWITNATVADWLLVLARHREGSHFTNFSWVLVPADAPGVSIEPADTALFTGAGVGHIHLDAVVLPTSAVIGGVGRGLPTFARHIAVERLAGGLWASAMCHRALSTTKKWLTGRGALWQRESVREGFARALVLARQLDALAMALGPRISEQRDHAAAALLKASAGITIDQVLSVCAHLHGAQGFTISGIQQLRSEAAVFGIAGGTTEIVLASVADQADRLLLEFAPSELRGECLGGVLR